MQTYNYSQNHQTKNKPIETLSHNRFINYQYSMDPIGFCLITY